jgi:hypothetical protein
MNTFLFDTTVIDTLDGDKLVSQLTTNDIVFNIYGNAVNILQIVKSDIPITTSAIFYEDRIVCTSNYMISYFGRWMKANSLLAYYGFSKRKVKKYVYQISTEELSVRSKLIILSTT